MGVSEQREQTLKEFHFSFSTWGISSRKAPQRVLLMSLLSIRRDRGKGLREFLSFNVVRNYGSKT